MSIRLTGRLLCGGLFFVTLVPIPASAAPVPPTVVTCSPATMKAIVSYNSGSTTSQIFQNLSEAQLVFVQGGAGPSCVVVRFSAEAGASPSPAAVVVRALLDSVTSAVPDGVTFGVFEEPPAARSYEFIFLNVAPGRHVVKMQFRSTNGSNVFIGIHSTIVLHTP
jgi:hypothetical protein